MTGPTDDDLRALWQDAANGMPIPALAEIQARASALRTRLLRRNLREYIAAAFVLCVFTAYAFIFPQPLCKLGAALICLADVFVVTILAWRGHPRDLDMGEDCIAFYAGELRRQRDLLKWAWLWYVAPFIPGMVLFMAGKAQGVAPAKHMLSYAFVAAVLGGIVWLNLYGARRLDRKLQDLTGNANGDK